MPAQGCHSKRHAIPPAALMILLWPAVGCLGPRRADYQSSAALSAGAEPERTDQLWSAALEVLRGHDLRLDRVDRANGVVTTLPETSQHFYEFWRRDVATREDFWDATLNPLRRWVEVSFAHHDDGAWTGVAVVVHKERMTSPDRQFNCSGAAYEFFGDTLPSTSGIVRVTAEHDHWVGCGTDPAMAERLLREILSSTGNEAVTEPLPPTGG
jgi:hypothetical protein